MRHFASAAIDVRSADDPDRKVGGDAATR